MKGVMLRVFALPQLLWIIILSSLGYGRSMWVDFAPCGLQKWSCVIVVMRGVDLQELYKCVAWATLRFLSLYSHFYNFMSFYLDIWWPTMSQHVRSYSVPLDYLCTISKGVDREAKCLNLFHCS